MAFFSRWIKTTLFIMGGMLVMGPIVAALPIEESEGFGLDDMAAAAILAAAATIGNKVL